jgi:UDP-galactose transporter B1
VRPDVPLSGELLECIAFVYKHPAVLQQMAIFSATMAMGNIFIFKLQHDFGALTVTRITTIRKLVSVLFSVLWFGHQMAAAQWIGVLVVFFADKISKGFVTALRLEEKSEKKNGGMESKKAK